MVILYVFVKLLYVDWFLVLKIYVNDILYYGLGIYIDVLLVSLDRVWGLGVCFFRIFKILGCCWLRF